MQFEWDEEKRQANLAKHGIDFERAILLFDGRPTVLTQSQYAFEERWLTTGILDEVFVTAVWTWRADAVRFISVRRAHDGEERKYYASYA